MKIGSEVAKSVANLFLFFQNENNVYSQRIRSSTVTNSYYFSEYVLLFMSVLHVDMVCM